MRPRTRRILTILALFIGTLLVIDAFLYHVDPYGIVTMWRDANQLTSLTTGSPDGWRLTPGIHEFKRYTAAVGLDGFRVVPETRVTDCTIAAPGDSVVFGMGSQTTFVNLLASDLPDVTLHNWGVPGYSAANILALMAFEPPVDGYIWLIYENDAEPFGQWNPHQHPMQPALLEYINLRIIQSSPRDLDPPEALAEAADEILSRENVLAFALEGRYLTDEIIRGRYPQVVIIPDYTDYSSRVDNHPGETGHQQLADSMREDVIEFAQRLCNQKAL